MNEISYMLSIEKLLSQAHKDSTLFTQALSKVSESLSAEIGFLWLATDDPVTERCCWISTPNAIVEGDADFRSIYPELYAKLNEENQVLCVDQEDLLRQLPHDGAAMSDKGIRQLMTVLVQNDTEHPRVVLGVCNCKTPPKDCRTLRLVSLSFYMAIDHYLDYAQLNSMVRVDSMTGLQNRNSYHALMSRLSDLRPEFLGCVYIDVNGLHEVNNHLGHREGDRMLQRVGQSLQKYFDRNLCFRIGGDEFVAFCRQCNEQELYDVVNRMQSELRGEGYEISVGVHWASGDFSPDELVNEAESRMRENKFLFYKNGGRERSLRLLNQKMELMVEENEDNRKFLSMLGMAFKGVYFVNLQDDTVRHLFIPPYFQEILNSVNESYQKAILEYAHRYVEDEYLPEFEQAADYQWLKQQLRSRDYVGFVYHRKDGEVVHLRIVRLEEEAHRVNRTLWIFSHSDTLDFGM